MTKRKVPQYDLEDLIKDMTPKDVSLDFDWGEDVGAEIVSEKESNPTRV